MQRRRVAGSLAASFILGLGAILFDGPAWGSENPVPQPPGICALTVRTAEAGEVVVTWTGGTPPFTVVRGDGEEFGRAKEVRILATDVMPRQFRDRIEAGNRYWYQVVDVNSPPLIFRIEVLGDGGPKPINGAADGIGGATVRDCHGIPRGPVTWASPEVAR